MFLRLLARDIKGAGRLTAPFHLIVLAALLVVELLFIIAAGASIGEGGTFEAGATGLLGFLTPVQMALLLACFLAPFSMMIGAVRWYARDMLDGNERGGGASSPSRAARVVSKALALALAVGFGAVVALAAASMMAGRALFVSASGVFDVIALHAFLMESVGLPLLLGMLLCGGLTLGAWLLPRHRRIVGILAAALAFACLATLSLQLALAIGMPELTIFVCCLVFSALMVPVLVLLLGRV